MIANSPPRWRAVGRVMAEYLIQRTGSTVPGVSVPRWFAGLATPTRPLWTADRKEARPFLTEDAARDQLRRIAQPEDQYEIVTVQ